MTLPKDGWIYWTKSASFLVADASWKLWWDTERQIRLKCGGHFPHHKDIERSIHQSHRVKYDQLVNGFPQRVSVVSTLFDHVIMWSCYFGFHLGPKKVSPHTDNQVGTPWFGIQLLQLLRHRMLQHLDLGSGPGRLNLMTTPRWHSGSTFALRISA